MTNTEIAIKAKAMAKGILHSQMAVRIQGRLSNAEEALKTALKSLVRTVSSNKATVKKLVENFDKAMTARDADRQAIGQVDGLSEAEAVMLADAFDAETAELKKNHEQALEREEKESTADLKQASEDVAEARKEVARYTEFLRKLDAGEADDALKVSLDDLKALTNRLIEEGRVTEDEA